MSKPIHVIVLIACCSVLNLIAVSAGFDTSITGRNKSIVAPQGVSYEWYLNGEKLKGLNKREIRVFKPGMYAVKVRKDEGSTFTTEAHIAITASQVVVIYLIGDSTMADYEAYYSADEQYLADRYPLTGWGQVFQQVMHSDNLSKLAPFITADSVIIDNHARGGRSTRTFWEEGRWSTVYSLIQPGDYLIIQFGHNDASMNHPDRYVDTAGYKDYLRLYVNETREKEGIPILTTPVNRNYSWVGDELTNIHGNYPQAMKEVAEELHVPLIDVTQRSLDFFSAKGRKYVTDHYFMNLEPGEYEVYPDGSDDNTHFQPEGARAVAQMVFNGMKDLRELNVAVSPKEAGQVKGNGWYEIKYDSIVTLKAYPNQGYVFDRWSGDISGDDNPIEVSLDTSRHVTANFKPADQEQFNSRKADNQGWTITTFPSISSNHGIHRKDFE